MSQARTQAQLRTNKGLRDLLDTSYFVIRTLTLEDSVELSRQLRQELEQTRIELAATQRELASVRSHLQAENMSLRRHLESALAQIPAQALAVVSAYDPMEESTTASTTWEELGFDTQTPGCRF